MGRMYSAPFKAVAVTAQQDFFEILAATGKPIVIHGFALTQETEVGDAAEEMLRVIINRGAGVTSGSGGSTVTPAPNGIDDIACGATVEINNTTKITGGTITELEAHAWNIRIPYIFWYTPETRPYVKPGDRLTMELETTPADSITISGTVWIEEIG